MIGSLPLRGHRLVQLGAALAALFAGAAVVGWRAGEAPTAAVPAQKAANWALPRSETRDPQRDAAILAARRPWGGGDAFRDIDAPRAPAPAAPWKLAGVIERGNQRLALVLVGQGAAARLEYRAVGDSLPDGSVLVQIGADSATSEGGQSVAAAQRVYRLFDKAH